MMRKTSIEIAVNFGDVATEVAKKFRREFSGRTVSAVDGDFKVVFKMNLIGYFL